MSTPNIEKTLTTKETFIFKDMVGPYFNPNWHFHPDFQISLIAEGKGTRFVGDHVQSFEKGDLFVENSVRGMEFYGETRNKINKLIHKINNELGFRRIIKLLEIIDILANSEEYHLLSSPGYTNVFKGDDADKMRIVYDYVMSNFKTKISLEEIAEMLNMTTTSFCRYFKPRANKTFTRFVNEIRIGHSRKLLLEDNFNISQISYECGFNALSNFNRQFKAIVHMSPHEYRKLFLNIKTSIS